MKINEITNLIEDFAPKSLAEEWDNVGLLVGNGNNDLQGILIAVDLTDDCVDYAIKNNINLIITHHPAIFSPLKNLNVNNFLTNMLCKCVKNIINVYSAHTNMDIANGGINDATFDKLNIKHHRFLDDGLGVYGVWNGKFDDLIDKIKDLTGDVYLRAYKKKENVCNVAFIGGSGGGMDEIVDKAMELGIDTIISSEFKHHIILALTANNINIIQLGHYESEKIFVEIVYELLKNKVGKIEKFYAD